MALVVFCSFLLLASGYVVQFQNWVVFTKFSQEKSLKNNALLGVEDSGIRAIVSQETVNSLILDKEVKPILAVPPSLAPAVDNLTDIKPVSTRFVAANKATDNPVRDILSSGVEKVHIDNMQTELPVIVEYDDEIIVEFSNHYSKYEIKKAISRLMVLPTRLDSIDIVSDKAIKTSEQPLLYKRIFDHNDHPIRYPAQAYRYAEYLITHELEEVQDNGVQYQLVKIPLKQYHLPNNVKRYLNSVNTYSNSYKVLPELVFAIMQVESNFKPRAVSPSNALGLMQVKAHTAGKDVYQLIDQKKGQPSQKMLFEPAENIRIGTAYIGLLQHNYLQQVRDTKKKELLTIASYNGGIASVLKLFGNSPEQALRKINQLHTKHVYRTLRYKHPSQETRSYLDKVLKAKSHYQELLEMAV